jgi:hypothetical protein
MSGFVFGASSAAALLILWMSWPRVGALALATVKGFDLLALIAPVAVLGAALLGTILLVRRWSSNKTQTGTEISDPALDALKEKIRRETGAGNDGGF